MEIAHSAASTSYLETQLWEQQRDRIYRYLLRLTGEPHTAEDLTQETFVHAIRDLRRHPDGWGDPTARVMRIATNRAMDLFRRRRLIRWLPFRVDRHGGAGDDGTESVATRDLVGACLRRLPPDMAVVLLLRDAEGFTAPEIAAMLDLDPAAVRKRLSRARDVFRQEYHRLKGDAP